MMSFTFSNSVFASSRARAYLHHLFFERCCFIWKKHGTFSRKGGTFSKKTREIFEKTRDIFEKTRDFFLENNVVFGLAERVGLNVRVGYEMQDATLYFYDIYYSTFIGGISLKLALDF